MLLKFKKIKSGDIFTQDFSHLDCNNEITFKEKEKIAVVYGPNGTGKTSLIKVLGDEEGTEVEFSIDGTDYKEGSKVFYIINDQNNRNIISGETSDFLLGDNIRHEFELKSLVTTDRNTVVSDILSLIKNKFGISASNSPLIELLAKNELAAFIKDCANSKSKGRKYTDDDLVGLLKSLEHHDIPDYKSEKLEFVQRDWLNDKSVIKQLEKLKSIKITPNAHVREIEENTEAIGILSRFNKDKCIVCDNENIDREKLLATKTAHRQETLDALDDEIKEVIEQIIPFAPDNDPFSIKDRLFSAIESGKKQVIVDLLSELKEYIELYSKRVENEIVEIVNGSELIAHHNEYQKIISERPDITDEDYLYIEEIISNNMSKRLTIKRDENNILRICLSNQEFLGKTREELPLSTGEQNFLSLTFEFLKAKNSECPIVVIDDPVSSFDSIYKNKVVYAIIKMLDDKKRIVLTHNTDLIRLLDAQYKNCFKLYMLNNTDGELNGFIPLKKCEREMLINLKELLTAFKESVPCHVLNPELFLISMIPFMRGYANIICNEELFNELTEVMHGYKTKKVDIAKAYSELFESQHLPDSYEVSVEDILDKTVDNVQLFDEDKFPLLERTLKHSFVYLFLRLLVEKNLVEKFGIDTNKNKQLGQIIAAAYPDANDFEQIRKRIQLTSKKTLINEFNHFEGNLSIFQPAIDITDQALEKERNDLIDFINNL